ncbi:hypothetical protein Trydic_g13193 [Trypoxylus dichotomus]
MPQTTGHLIDSKICAVIRFLNATDIKAAEIHQQISEVYGENAMISVMVRKWLGAFKEHHTNVHDEKRNAQPPAINGAES